MNDCQYCDMDNDTHDRHCPGAVIERLSAEYCILLAHSQAAFDGWKNGVDVVGPMHKLSVLLETTASTLQRSEND